MSRSRSISEETSNDSKFSPFQIFKHISPSSSKKIKSSQASSPPRPQPRLKKHLPRDVDEPTRHSDSASAVQAKRQNFTKLFSKPDKPTRPQDVNSIDRSQRVFERQSKSAEVPAAELTENPVSSMPAAKVSSGKVTDSSCESLSDSRDKSRKILFKQDSFDFGPIEISAATERELQANRKLDESATKSSSSSASKLSFWNQITSFLKPRKSDVSAPPAFSSASLQKEKQDKKSTEVKRRSAALDPDVSFGSQGEERGNRLKDTTYPPACEPLASAKKGPKKGKITKTISSELAERDASNHYKKRFALTKIFSRPSSPRRVIKTGEDGGGTGRGDCGAEGSLVMNSLRTPMATILSTEEGDSSSATRTKTQPLLYRLRTGSDTNVLEAIAKKRKFFSQEKNFHQRDAKTESLDVGGKLAEVEDGFEEIAKRPRCKDSFFPSGHANGKNERRSVFSQVKRSPLTGSIDVLSAAETDRSRSSPVAVSNESRGNVVCDHEFCDIPFVSILEERRRSGRARESTNSLGQDLFERNSKAKSMSDITEDASTPSGPDALDASCQNDVQSMTHLCPLSRSTPQKDFDDEESPEMPTWNPPSLTSSHKFPTPPPLPPRPNPSRGRQPSVGLPWSPTFSEIKSYTSESAIIIITSPRIRRTGVCVKNNSLVPSETERATSSSCSDILAVTNDMHLNYDSASDRKDNIIVTDLAASATDDVQSTATTAQSALSNNHEQLPFSNKEHIISSTSTSIHPTQTDTSITCSSPIPNSFSPPIIITTHQEKEGEEGKKEKNLPNKNRIKPIGINRSNNTTEVARSRQHSNNNNNSYDDDHASPNPHLLTIANRSKFSSRKISDSQILPVKKNTVRFLNEPISEEHLEAEDKNSKQSHRLSLSTFTSNKDGSHSKQQSVFAPIKILRRRATSVVENPAGGANMFGRKAQADVKKSAAKVLDLKKDTVTRLKHLRVVIESYDVAESKLFFEQFYSHIYFLFHEGFSSVETSLGQRASKAHREELDYMLFVFEKILIFLPEMIHKRWQVHSISRIMKKLLHPGNSLKLRREGLRLFLIWYQILMENATEDCHNMFCSLVWGGKLTSACGRDADLDVFTVKTFHNTKASVPDICPLVPPQSGDKTPSNLTRYFLEALLYCLVSEVNKVEWTNKESQYFAFMFLFNKFKKFYLLQFFPDFDFNFTIYRPDLSLPERRDVVVQSGTATPNTMVVCQEIIVKWFFTYGDHLYRTKLDVDGSSGRTSDVAGSSAPVDEFQSTETHSASDLRIRASSDPGEPGGPGSNASTLSLGSSFGCGEKPPEGSEEQNVDRGEAGGECAAGFALDARAVELVNDVLYDSRENVNIVHEVFRQAFLWASNDEELNSTRRAVNVYKDWFTCAKAGSKLPVFMEEPMEFDESAEKCRGKEDERECSVQVRAGLQNVLRTFFTTSSNVFFVFFDVPKSSGDASQSSSTRLTLRLEKQVEICKRVLNIYRYSVTNLNMDSQTWEQLLMVLLKATSVVMSHDPPSTNQKPTLAKNLAEPLFKTLIVTWIKANVNFAVGANLWQQFTVVLSSLTHWIDLIKEWAKIMEVMTRIFSKFVYGLNINDLPLDRLTEQKVKRLKGTRGAKVASKAKECSEHDSVVDQARRASFSKKAPSKSGAMRQRSRSGDLSPLQLSRADVAADNATNDAVDNNSNFLILPSPGGNVDRRIICSVDRYWTFEVSM